MDKKQKIIAVTASIAVIIAIAGASLGGFGWLQSSAFRVQEKIQLANQSLSNTHAKLSSLQGEKQVLNTSLTKVNTTINSVRIACLGYRSSLERIAKKVQEAENALRPLQESYDAKIASRNALQKKFNDNKGTIDTNTKVVIPGIQKEQKKYKSTSAEYKKLTTDITTTKNQNTALTKENTDAKTGLQKQINALVAEIKVLEKIGSPLKVAQANVQSAKSSRPSKDETSACTTYDTAQAEKTRLSEQLSRIDAQMAQTNTEIQTLEAQLAKYGVDLTETQNQEAQEQAQKDLERTQNAAEMNRIIEEARKQQAADDIVRAQALQICLVEARTISIENDTQEASSTGTEDLSLEARESECQRVYGVIDRTGTTTSGTSGEGTTTGGDGGTTGTTSGTSGDGGTTGGTGDGATAGTLGTTAGTYGGTTGTETWGYCGNWIVEPPEMCDDANSIVGDGCSDRCITTKQCPGGKTVNSNQKCAVCGNGTVDAWELCDDGNTEDDDLCSSDCLYLKVPQCVEREDPMEITCDNGRKATITIKTNEDCSTEFSASSSSSGWTHGVIGWTWNDVAWIIKLVCAD